MTKEIKRNNPIIQTKYADYHAIRQERFDNPLKATVAVVNRIMLDQRANFAAACIERWGMISGAPDGEDAAGRQRGRLLTPTEIVERACDTAEAAYASFEARGWTVSIPSINEMIDTIKDYENGND